MASNDNFGEEKKKSEELEVSQEYNWSKNLAKSTKILYIAIGSADYTKPEKRFQAFPTFIQQAIEQSKDKTAVQIIAADRVYPWKEVPPGYGNPAAARKFGYHVSALRNFLNKNPQYKQNIHIYDCVSLNREAEFLKAYLKAGNMLILANFTGDDELALNPLKKLMNDDNIHLAENVHYLTNEKLTEVHHYDSFAYYDCGSLGGKVISLDSNELPNKDMIKEKPKSDIKGP